MCAVILAAIPTDGSALVFNSLLIVIGKKQKPNKQEFKKILYALFVSSACVCYYKSVYNRFTLTLPSWWRTQNLWGLDCCWTKRGIGLNWILLKFRLWEIWIFVYICRELIDNNEGPGHSHQLDLTEHNHSNVVCELPPWTLHSGNLAIAVLFFVLLPWQARGWCHWETEGNKPAACQSQGNPALKQSLLYWALWFTRWTLCCVK